MKLSLFILLYNSLFPANDVQHVQKHYHVFIHKTNYCMDIEFPMYTDYSPHFQNNLHVTTSFSGRLKRLAGKCQSCAQAQDWQAANQDCHDGVVSLQ